MTQKLAPVTPGDILLHEFMLPLSISQNQLARDLDVPVGRISDLVHARRGITPDTALRLGTYFQTSPEFWINLQSRYDLKIARAKVGEKIQRRVRPHGREVA